MRAFLKYLLVFTLFSGAIACNNDNKKPDAVVISNEDAEKEETAAVQNALDTADLTTSYQDTAIENYTVSETDNEAPGNREYTGATGSTENNTSATTRITKGSDAPDKITPAAEQPDNVSETPVRRPVRTKMSVQQQLARDARLAKQMSLARFGRYMERRADYYRNFGEVNYEDKTVEIKITREELKIETPEGKYKRESDERKIKTAAGKVKQETRR